jgi:hypothetical protein
MFFQGDPVKVIGRVDPEAAEKFYSKLYEKFNNKWVRRTFALMDTSYCLKAISPSNFDKLDTETETDLKSMLMPWVEPYVSANEVIVYLDVSSLPPGAQSKAHVDYTWFHLMSKRIRIPLITNPKSTFSLLTDNSSIKTYNLKVGKVYETNNSVIHMAANLGDTPRWHIVADILDKRIYEYLIENNKLSSWGLHPSINFCLNPEVAARLEEALKSDPINI